MLFPFKIFICILFALLFIYEGTEIQHRNKPFWQLVIFITVDVYSYLLLGRFKRFPNHYLQANLNYSGNLEVWNIELELSFTKNLSTLIT